MIQAKYAQKVTEPIPAKIASLNGVYVKFNVQMAAVAIILMNANIQPRFSCFCVNFVFLHFCRTNPSRIPIA